MWHRQGPASGRSFGAEFAAARRDRPKRAGLGHLSSAHAARTNGMSSSTSAPIRCAVQAKRRPSSSRSTGGSGNAGTPPPMTSGATVTCSRSSAPAARKRDTVTPPPSTKIRRRPRARSNARIAAISSPDGPARHRQHPRASEPLRLRHFRRAEQQRFRTVVETPGSWRSAGDRGRARRGPGWVHRPAAWSAADYRRGRFSLQPPRRRTGRATGACGADRPAR